MTLEEFYNLPPWVHEDLLDYSGYHLAWTIDGQLVWLRQYEYLRRDDISCSRAI